MDKLSFEELPEAIGKLLQRFDYLEQLIISQQTTQPKESGGLLTIQQAGEFLNLSVPTIYGLVSRSEIPHSKKGKASLFLQTRIIGMDKVRT